MKLVYKNILEFLDENGLEVTEDSGGSFVEYSEFEVFKNNLTDLHYEMKCDNSFTISVISPEMFYETFKETEKDLKLALFG